MSSYGCAAGVIPLGLFNDAISGWVNRGACWDKSQRLGARPDTTRTHSHRVHMFADVMNTDSLISLSLCLSLTHKYTDVGCFSLNCSMCCAPFLMRKIISQLFNPQLQRLFHVLWVLKHTHTHTHIVDTWLREQVRALQVTNHSERPGKVSDTVNSLMLIN